MAKPRNRPRVSWMFAKVAKPQSSHSGFGKWGGQLLADALSHQSVLWASMPSLSGCCGLRLSHWDGRLSGDRARSERTFLNCSGGNARVSSGRGMIPCNWHEGIRLLGALSVGGNRNYEPQRRVPGEDIKVVLSATPRSAGPFAKASSSRCQRTCKETTRSRCIGGCWIRDTHPSPNPWRLPNPDTLVMHVHEGSK